MKKTLFTLIFLFLSSLSLFAQTDTAKSDAPNPETVARVAKYSDLTEPEKKILIDYLTARASIAFCGFVPDGPGCKENSGYEQKFSDALSSVVRSPKLTSYIVSNAAKSFEGGKLNARSAPQISQIAAEQEAELMRVMVMQNQRIIELLEQISKKK